jgi:large subunit ribosomal protein L3
MSLGMLGHKIGMTQIFDESGNVIPVTVLHVGPCIVTQIKTVLTDGYNAIQVGYDNVPPQTLRKPEQGHLKKSGGTPLKYLQEYKIGDVENFILGQSISMESFENFSKITVTGKSIGKGFAGNQKRHNFGRGPMTHGSKNHRAPGSIGAGTTPGRVIPGKKMAGRLGGNKITTKNLDIIKMDSKENLLIVKGAVPGKPGNLLNIQFLNSKKD